MCLTPSSQYKNSHCFAKPLVKSLKEVMYFRLLLGTNSFFGAKGLNPFARNGQ